jgi:hypothetical protein
MTDQTPEYVPPPSEVLDATQLDQALLVLVVRQNGTAFSAVRSDVDRASLSAWVHEFADRILGADCADCRDGNAHNHADEPPGE